MICCLVTTRFSSAFLTARRLNSRRGSSSSAHLSTRKTSSTISARPERGTAVGGLVPIMEPDETSESDSLLRKLPQQAVTGSTTDHSLDSSDEALEAEESSTTGQIEPDSSMNIGSLQDPIADKDIIDSGVNKTKKVKTKDTKDQSSKHPRDLKDVAASQKKVAPHDICIDSFLKSNVVEGLLSPVSLISTIELEEKIQKAEKSFRKGKSKSTEISAVELPIKGIPLQATSITSSDKFQGNIYDFSDALNSDSNFSSAGEMHDQDEEKVSLSQTNQTDEEDQNLPHTLFGIVNKTYSLDAEPEKESKIDQKIQERNYFGLIQQVEDFSVSSASTFSDADADAYSTITSQDLLDFAILNEIVIEKKVDVTDPINDVFGMKTKDNIVEDSKMFSMNQGSILNPRIDHLRDDINVNDVNVVNEELEKIKIFSSVESWDPCMTDQWSSSEINVFGNFEGSMESSSSTISISNIVLDFNLDTMSDSVLYDDDNNNKDNNDNDNNYDIGLKIDTVGNEYLFDTFDNEISDELSIDYDMSNKRNSISNKEEKYSGNENILNAESSLISKSENESDNIDMNSRKLNREGSVKHQNNIDINIGKNYDESSSENKMKNESIKIDNGKEIQSDKQISNTNDKILQILLELEEKINCLEDELQDEKHRSTQLIQAFLKMEIEQDLLRAEFLEYKINNFKDNRELNVAEDQ